jgi:putative oxidoreductase
MRCCCLYTDQIGARASAGLLPLRVAVGLAFIFHGLPKVQNAFAWMGSESPVPGVLQAVAAVAEFGGGAALLVGLLTRLASLGILSVMIGALALVHVPHGDPFVGKPGQSSAEPATVYLCCAVLFLVVGPGRYSLDALLFGKACPVSSPDHAR